MPKYLYLNIYVYNLFIVYLKSLSIIQIWTDMDDEMADFNILLELILYGYNLYQTVQTIKTNKESYDNEYIIYYELTNDPTMTVYAGSHPQPRHVIPEPYTCAIPSPTAVKTQASRLLRN